MATDPQAAEAVKAAPAAFKAWNHLRRTVNRDIPDVLRVVQARSIDISRRTSRGG